MKTIMINADVSISEKELTFGASRSSGPGGQNVNKTSTRVTLHFDVRRSPSLSDEQKDRISRRLATRVSQDGILRVVAQQSRSQSANRALALERFVELLRGALARRRVRKPTRVPREARQRRLEEKRRRGDIKMGRGGGREWEE